MDKKNHGLPSTLENGWQLKVVKPNEMLESDGLTEQEVHDMYDEGDDKVVNLYYYEDEETGDSSVRIGIEFSSGRLAVYGCRRDISDCKTEENFVTELTDHAYNM